MDTDKRYFILVVTTFLSLFVVLLAEFLLTSFAVYHRPAGHTFIVLGGSLITLFALLTAQPLFAFFGRPQVGLQVNATIWLLYMLDIGSLIYLVSTTGGLTQSPYVSFLLLLPTNGILMAQPYRTVAWYFAGVGIVGAFLCLLPETQLLQGTGILVHKLAHLGVFLFVFAIALVGYWYKEAPSKPRSAPMQSPQTSPQATSPVT
jgi:hypothetical protein